MNVKIIKVIIILILIILIIFFINHNKKSEHLVDDTNINPILRRCSDILTENVYSNINVMNKLLINDKDIYQMVYDYAFPVGSFYVQFPAADSSVDVNEFPDSERPETIFGGHWQEQWPQESIYFRTKGLLSNEERDERGFQDYATRHLYGSLSHSQTDYGKQGAGNTGVFSVTNLDQIGTDDNKNTMHGMRNFFNLQAQILPSDLENRVKNRRVKIWKRVLKNPNGKYPDLPDYGHDTRIDKNYYDGIHQKKQFGNYKAIPATSLNEAMKICNENEKCKFIGKRSDLWYSSEAYEMIDGDDTTSVWEKKQGKVTPIMDIPVLNYKFPDIKEEEYENDEDRPEGWYNERPEGYKWTTSFE